MNIDKCLSLLNKIMNDMNEKRPSKSDPSWLPINDYHVMGKQQATDVTNELINLMDNYTKIYKQTKQYITDDIIKKCTDNIIIIYLIENKRNGEKYVGFTSYPFQAFIKHSIHLHNMKKHNIFNRFIETDIKWFTFTLLEYVHYKDRTHVDERLSYHRDIHVADIQSDSPTKKYEPKDDFNFLYEERVKLLHNIISKYKTKMQPFHGYIFALVSPRTQQVFIGGTQQKISFDEIKALLRDNQKLKHCIHELKLAYIEKYRAYCSFEFMLRIDYYKLKFDSINDGYNIDYSYPKSPILFADIMFQNTRKRIEKDLFLKIQKLFFEEYFIDKTDYTNVYGFVYKIEHAPTNRKFFAYSTGTTLHDIIAKLYNDIEQQDKTIKQTKLHKTLLNNPYFDFEFTVIKTKHIDDTKIDLMNEVELLISKYNTINAGLNVPEPRLRQIDYDMQ